MHCAALYTVQSYASMCNLVHFTQCTVQPCALCTLYPVHCVGTLWPVEKFQEPPLPRLIITPSHSVLSEQHSFWSFTDVPKGFTDAAGQEPFRQEADSFRFFTAFQKAAQSGGQGTCVLLCVGGDDVGRWWAFLRINLNLCSF